MKTIFQIAFFLLLAVCHKNVNADGAGTFTDLCGNRITFHSSPSRILSVASSATSAIVSLGAGGRIVAVDEYSSRYSWNSEVVSKGSVVAVEKVLALGVDCAFVWWYQGELADILSKHKIPVVRIGNLRAAELPRLIDLIAGILDERDRGDSLSAEIKTCLRNGSSVNSRGPSVFVELYTEYRTCGQNTYVNDLVELAGGQNIASAQNGCFTISAETIFSRDPDIILFVDGFSSLEKIKSRPGFASLKAVRNNMVFGIDKRVLTAGPEFPEALNSLRKIFMRPDMGGS